MSKSVKKSQKGSEEFVLMRRTKALLSEVWDIWRENLGHTPDVAKRMIDAGIKELHRAEKEAIKTTTTSKKKVVKKVKAIAKKPKSSKRTSK